VSAVALISRALAGVRCAGAVRTATRRLSPGRGLLSFVGCLVVLAGVPTLGWATDQPITFSVTGDVPYGDSEVPVFQGQVNSHNVYSPSDFFVHLGDVFSGSESCAEFRYSRVADIMHQLTVPAYVIPGDNETTDCANPGQGFQLWTQYFQGFENAFCGVPTTTRQASRPENFTFLKDGVLFVGINLVGGTNDTQIMLDDAAWTTQQLQTYQSSVRAAVIFAQAGPGGNHSTFFTPFVQAAASFAKPILYIHGDGHVWLQDRPFGAAQNVLRTQVDRGGLAPPVQITVSMDAVNPFVFNRNPWPAGTPPYNRPPCVQAGPDQTIALGQPATLVGVATDNWVPNNPPILTYAWSQMSGPGTVSFSAPNALSTSATFSVAGTYVVRLTVNDGALSSSDDVTVIVTSGANQPPVANDDAYQLNRNQTLNVAAPGVLGNDTDPDGDTLNTIPATTPTHGTLSLASNGSFTYTPATNYSGTDAFTYTANDGHGGTDNATVALTVIAPPTISFFTPGSGPVGVSVAVHGGSFTSAQTVKFNGVSASFTVAADTLLQATVPAGASTGPIAVTNPAGTATSAAAFTVIVPPTISFFTPGSGPVGASVSVHGGSFTSAQTVKFNGVSASFTVVADTMVQATVPAGASTGPIAVTNPAGTATSAAAFTVILPPTISFFAPGSGPVGASVAVHGASFTTTQTVKFNSVSASFTVVADTILQATVPAGATTGPIAVTNPAGTATSAAAFTVIVPPTISFFTPSAGTAGATVAIHGTHFASAQTVKFNGVSASFTVVADTMMQATVPAGASTGPITVTNPAGTATSAAAFTVITPPTITFFTPGSGPVGTQVAVHGAHFASTQAVAFNGVSAAFTVVADTMLQATVPAGANTGPIAVTNADGTGISATPFSVIAPPVMSSFAPSSGPVGAVVSVYGMHLATTQTVTFNGAPAGFTVDADTLLRATVPGGATSGPIAVTTPAGTAASAGTFTVLVPPVITFFAPASGLVGSEVTVHGMHFANTQAVTFNGLAAGFTVDADTVLRAIVPTGASTGPIAVTNPDGTATSSGVFTVIGAPVITSFAPGSGVVGAQVTVHGLHFTGTQTVRFNGVSAGFTVVADTLLQATVPVGASTGPISVTNPAGSVASAGMFTVIVPPVISFFAPGSGVVGVEVAVHGAHFTTTQAVKFNAVSAAFTVDADTLLRATVPAGASTGPISVTNPAGAATSSGSFTVIGPPVVSSFTPGSGGVGSQVIVSGANFATAQSVAFNGQPAGFTVDSDVSIRAVVPIGAKRGRITVTNPSGTGTSAQDFRVTGPSSPVAAPLPAVPSALALHPNRPNPFSALGTTISFDLPVSAPVRLAVYDIHGRKIQLLRDAPLDPGTYTLQWDGCDEAGKPLPKGLYFLRLDIPGAVRDRKMLLVR
jgi:Big-like domain-containing protein/K319-like protein/IPT/TIG domain-containing protein